jgi:hypothetical protein
MPSLGYRHLVRVEQHWWNGDRSARGRRDVYVRTDGETWEVQAMVGGTDGRSRVHRCPSKAAAEILAGAWMGGMTRWRKVSP